MGYILILEYYHYKEDITTSEERRGKEGWGCEGMVEKGGWGK